MEAQRSTAKGVPELVVPVESKAEDGTVRLPLSTVGADAGADAVVGVSDTVAGISKLERPIEMQALKA